MGLLRKVAVVASGTAMVAGISVAGLVNAGPASASATAARLCSYYAGPCATAPSALGEQVQMPASGYSNWYYPSPGLRTIKRLNTNDCMSEDNSAVIYVTCNGEQAQLWDEYLSKTISVDGTSQTIYMYQNTSGNCLEYGADAGVLDAFPCNKATNGQWFAILPPSG
jgi:hypothetical protein